MKNKTVLFLLSFCINFTCFGQHNSPSQIIQTHITENNVPGLAFLVARNGKIIEEGYFGKSNLELNVPVTEKSVFAIASMSKAYTATAILLLAQQKKLALDDPIKKYIPEAPASWDSISLKHLLVHTSGLPDDWDLYSWEESASFFLKTETNKVFLDSLFKQKLAFEPGTEVSYACGPFVLGIVIEKVSGLKYSDFMRREVFEPLDLKNTWVDHPYLLIPNRVSGYFPHDSTIVKTGVEGLGNGLLMSSISYGRADVGIRTTARDLLKFYHGLIPEKLLDAQSLKIMFNPSTLKNGQYISTSPGWMNWPIAGNITHEHSGIFRIGFASQILVLPKDKLVIIVLTNLFEGSNFLLAQEIAAIYNPDFALISKRSIARDSNPNLTSVHMDVLKALSSNSFDPETVNSNFPISYYSKKLKKSISEIESIEFIGEEDISTRNVVLFGVKIHSLRYYKLNKETPLYTCLSLEYLPKKDDQ